MPSADRSDLGIFYPFVGHAWHIEGGWILTPAVLGAAIEDALEPYGVRVTSLPITASR